MRVGTRVRVMTAASVVMFLLVGTTCYLSVTKLIDSYKWVLHTQVVLEELQETLFNLADAAANERGYLITNQVSYLDAYRVQSKASMAQVASLRDLVQDNVNQKHRLAELEVLIKERLDAFETNIDTFQNQGREQAFELVKNGTGQSWMSKVRQKIGAMHDEEIMLLEKRNDDVQRSARNAQMTILAGVLFAVTFICVFNLFYVRDITVRTKALLKAAENIERGRLDELPISDSDDEFSELADAFNHVVGLLRRKIDELTAEVNTFGTVNTSLRHLLSSLSQVSAEAQFAAQETMQASAQARLLHSYATASHDQAAVALQASCDKAAAAAQSSTELCERVAALERMSLNAESIAAELTVVGLAASMETARMGESGAAFQSISERLSKLTTACQEQSISAKQMLSLAQSLTTRVKTSSEDSGNSMLQSRELLDQMEKQLSSSSNALSEMYEAVSRLTEICNRHREELGAARSKAEAVVAELLVKRDVAAEELEMQMPEKSPATLV
jgi:CHASE3 domain sensor protein